MSRASPPTTTEAHSSQSAGTPLYSCTFTQTSTRMVEKRKTTSTVTSTTTRTKTVVITESPSRSHPKPPRFPPPADNSDNYSDSDDPNDDATIQFATDSEEEYSPPTSASRPTSVYVTTRSESTHQRLSSPDVAPRPTADPEPSSDDDQIAAYYEARYPGRVPFPGEPDNASLRGFPIYYVVTAGRSVGIFTDWNYTSSLMNGVRNASHQSHTQSFRAWTAYRRAWESKKIRILDTYQDTAPLYTQIVDNGLDQDFGRLSLV